MVEDLYRRYRDELLRFAKNMTQETAMAEDLVQETFYRALKNREMLEELDESQGRAWLYRTLKNHYRDLLRRQKYETVAEPDGEAGSEAEGYGEVGMESLLAALPPQERRLFRMRYLEGYNSSELGELFGIPPATVRMKLSAARRKLRGEWED